MRTVEDQAHEKIVESQKLITHPCKLIDENLAQSHRLALAGVIALQAIALAILSRNDQ